ncbi:hypothetical protein DdX_11847 [Ditylenchus destructor]|uniref:Uncharacterized protein n=1 Tax=Ditylenchus destructor TaxID=166010 RepID=A0AAD4R487_9BILA|nr:hypothetical protein DdX_11847 [Ditylenchus destructor]
MVHFNVFHMSLLLCAITSVVAASDLCSGENESKDSVAAVSNAFLGKVKQLASLNTGKERFTSLSNDFPSLFDSSRAFSVALCNSLANIAEKNETLAELCNFTSVLVKQMEDDYKKTPRIGKQPDIDGETFIFF